MKREPVTIPKFPPPPRMAKKRSLLVSSEAVINSPAASTISTDRMLSQLSPSKNYQCISNQYLQALVSQPIPPPRDSPLEFKIGWNYHQLPPTPVVEIRPPGVAKLKALHITLETRSICESYRCKLR